MDPNGSNVVRLTYDSAQDAQPAWSPDGTKIAFVSDRDGNADIYVMNADGSGPVNITNHAGADYVRPGAGLVARAYEIFGWVRSGKLKVHIHKEYKLADAAEAHRDIASRNTIGKLLLLP